MRQLLEKLLRKQAIRYLSKYPTKIVAVTGSIGKTSTTQAIATVLSSGRKVRKTIKNYNSAIGVPCSIFGKNIPETLYNPVTWGWIIVRNEIQMLRKPSFDTLVLELGTDRIGEIIEFSWLPVDIAVVTAVAAEHMEYFKTLDAVAEEELSVSSFAKKTFINSNMVDKKFLKPIESRVFTLFDDKILKKIGVDTSKLQVVGKHSFESVAAAVVVARELGFSDEQIASTCQNIVPEAGRMNILKGINDSVLIDDTYNSSPEAVTAALDYLYSLKSPQRIALLGNMNELGDYSRQAHIDIGEYCDPKKLDFVVTLGVDANRYTAVAAEANECRVFEVTSPYQAGEVIKQNMKQGATILFKGSQNGVFAEEAVKMLLENPDDEQKLVRQSIFWKTKKLREFGRI